MNEFEVIFELCDVADQAIFEVCRGECNEPVSGSDYVRFGKRKDACGAEGQLEEKFLQGSTELIQVLASNFLGCQDSAD